MDTIAPSVTLDPQTPQAEPRRLSRPWAERLADHAFAYGLITLVITLVAGVLSTVYFHQQAQQEAQAELQGEVRRLAIQLDRVVNEGTISGTLKAMGRLDGRIQERLTLGRAVDLSERAFIVGADGLLLVDSNGRVLERWDPDQERFTAPGWSEALGQSGAGEGPDSSVVQVVIDATSTDHSLLLVAPVWSSSQPPGLSPRLIGSLVARLDPGTVRRSLAMSNARITLVAPNGRLVGASTAQGALLRPALADEARTPEGLFPLPPGSEGSGASRVVVRHRLGWNSPQMTAATPDSDAVWSIVVTQDLPPIDWAQGPQVRPTLVLLLVIPTLLLLLFKLLRMRRDRRLSQEQLRQQNRDSAEQAQWRSQINRVALALQEARSARAAAQVYLQLTQELLGNARGVVYRLQDAGELVPIGQWACTGPVEPVRLGQGLVGQAAQDRRTLECALHDLMAPNTIVSGLGRSAPRHRMVVPLQNLDECMGVTELEWLSSATAQRQQRVAEVAELLAMNLRFLRTTEALPES